MFATPRDYRSVRAVLVESNPQVRSDMRIALLEKGIREPITCRSADEFVEVAGREMLDLVVCDSGSFDGQFAPTMQRMRHNALGGNPFVVAIATVNEPSADQVQTVLSGGVDDLLRKPAPAKKVVDRIDLLVKERRPFIATRNYVGPTRANIAAAPAGNDDELIAVPNTLRGKVVEKATDATLRRAVAKAAAGLKEKINEHPLAGVDRLIRRAVTWQGGDDAELERHFANLQALSLEMSGHYRGAGYLHIANLALALSKLADRIAQHKPPEPTQVDLDLLNQLGRVVRGAMASEEGSKSTIQEIAAMVDRYAGGSAPRSHTYH